MAPRLARNVSVSVRAPLGEGGTDSPPNGISFSGHSTASYWSTGGVSAPSFGNIASNGPIAIGGSSTVNGSAITNSSLPGNLKIVMMPNPTNGNPLYASIYAPQSDVSIGGTGSIYGSVLGKTINMSGTGDVYYDMSLDSTNGQIALVQ